MKVNQGKGCIPRSTLIGAIDYVVRTDASAIHTAGHVDCEKMNAWVPSSMMLRMAAFGRRSSAINSQVLKCLVPSFKFVIKFPVESEKRNKERESAAESCAFCQSMDNFVREYPRLVELSCVLLEIRESDWFPKCFLLFK